MDYLTLSWWDYFLFSLVLGISVAIGIYYGFYKKRQSVLEDYSFGERDLKMFPVGMSLAATVLSGSAILLFPAEVYLYGVGIWTLGLALISTVIVMRCIYLPIFYKLNINSPYEYLQIRFDRPTRKVASFLYICYTFTYLPVAIYGPSLALNQVAGFDTNTVGAVMMLLCTCYTVLGGFRAVVWADTFQMVIVLFGLLATLAMGIVSAGGMKGAWRRAEFGDRLDFFNMDPDVTRRDTFWTTFIGNACFTLMHAGLNPSAMQRTLSAKSLRDSTKILIICAVVTAITVWITIIAGIVIYARYYDCDPLSAHGISKIDQLVPYYIMDVGREIRGLSGMFTAALFCAGFSTASTILNVLPGVIYADFLISAIPKTVTERRLAVILKSLTVLVGIVALGLMFIIGQYGSIIEILLNLGGMIHGPILSLFTMGALFSFVNAKVGALFGCISSVIIMVWTTVQRKMRNVPHQPPKPLSTDGCNVTAHFNISQTVLKTVTKVTSGEHSFLLTLSMNYHTLAGCLIGVVLGLIVSWLTKERNSPPVNVDALSPVVHRFVRRSNGDAEGNLNCDGLELLHGIPDKSSRS